MVALVSGWVKNIILIVLFASFLELLLPNSSLQRFIRVIMGLLIMLAILNPAIDLVQGNWTVGDMPTLAAGGQKQADIIQSANTAAVERERITKEIYKRDMSKQLRALIMAIDGVSEARVAIELQEKPEAGATGAIKAITLYVKPGNVSRSGTINKVSVKTSEHPELELNDAVRNKIKNMLTELYHLRGDQIDIKPWT